jgi:RNA polymerase sigma factor (sigma-70 family)
MSAEFQELLARARTGDPDALAAIAREYEPEVRTVARLRLGPALRPYLDSVDLVQSVHRSLLIGLRNDKFTPQSAGDLVALAVTIVRRKAARHWQRVRRQQRDSHHGEGGEPLPDLLLNLTDPADPAAEAATRDTFERICGQLDATERQVIERHLEGYSTAEIARLYGLNADVLRVKVSRLRQRLRAAGLASDVL